MAEATVTLKFDAEPIKTLIDECQKLVSACRDLQQARPPQWQTEQATTPQADTKAPKYAALETLLNECIDDPKTWHSVLLDADQKTTKAFRKVKNHLKYVARKRGINLSVRRKLDADDEGDFAHAKVRVEGAN